MGKQEHSLAILEGGLISEFDNWDPPKRGTLMDLNQPLAPLSLVADGSLSKSTTAAFGAWVLLFQKVSKPSEPLIPLDKDALLLLLLWAK